MDNIKAKAAACHAGFMAINAKLTDKLRAADDAGALAYSVASTVGGGNGEVDVLYAKTAEGQDCRLLVLAPRRQLRQGGASNRRHH